MVLDKTGTITRGEPKVTDLITAEGVSEAELLETAYALEARSEHPLARRRSSDGRGKKAERYADVQDFLVRAGQWSDRQSDNGDQLIGGNLTFLSMTGSVCLTDVKTVAQRLAEEGKTPLLFARSKTRSWVLSPWLT